MYGIIPIRTLWNKHLGFKLLQNVSVRDNRPASCIFMMNVVSPPEDGHMALAVLVNRDSVLIRTDCMFFKYLRSAAGCFTPSQT